MESFQIDFFELAFLAEACIPPRPIARMMFWQHLTDYYITRTTSIADEYIVEVTKFTPKVEY